MNNENELTAALATIEKCLAITGCPAGVDLQDYLRQLAAENVGLERVPETDSVAMLLALDSFRSESLPDVGLQKAFKSLIYHRKTPATDAYLAVIKADGVEMFAAEQRGVAERLQKRNIAAASRSISFCLDSAKEAEVFAKQLREGAK